MTLWETNSRLNRFMPIFGYLSWLSTSLRITNNWFNNWFPFRACPSTSFRLGEVARFGADVVTPTSPHWSPVECLQIQTSKEVSHLNVTVGWAEGKTKTIPLKKKVSSKTHYISNYIYNLRDLPSCHQNFGLKFRPGDRNSGLARNFGSQMNSP